MTIAAPPAKPRPKPRTGPQWDNPRHRSNIAGAIETQYLAIDPDTMQPEAEAFTLLPHQVRIINHIFTLIPQGTGRPRILPYDTIVYSAPKKSGKTALGAAITYAWARTYGGEMYSLANAQSQARDRAYLRLYNFLAHIQRTDPDRYDREVTRRDANLIEFAQPYARFEAIPCSPGSQAGSFVSLSLWDELWSYEHESANRLWAEFSPIPQLFGRSCRLVVTYAGYFGQSQLLYSLYEQTVAPDPDTGQPGGIRIRGLEDLPCFVSPDGRTFAYWETDALRVPWITQQFLDARKADPSIRAEEYARLWENRWTSSHGAFLPAGVYDRACAAGDRLGLVNAWADIP